MTTLCNSDSTRRLGIALGSGAARGWAHIGVLEVLREEQLEPGFVAGTSIGSLVGAAYLSGKLDDLKDAAVDLDLRSILYYFLELGLNRSGMIDGHKVFEFLGKRIGSGKIEDLPRPFCCVATDILEGREVLLRDGELRDAVRASISIPGLFTPVYRDEMVLVDGGVTNPIPTEHARALGAQVVISVDINAGRLTRARRSVPINRLEKMRELAQASGKDPLGWRKRLATRLEELQPEALGRWKRWLAPDPIPGMVDILGNSVRIMEEQIAAARLQLHPPDILLQPEVGHLNILEFNHADEAIAAGRKCAEQALPAIRRALDR